MQKEKTCAKRAFYQLNYIPRVYNVWRCGESNAGQLTFFFEFFPNEPNEPNGWTLTFFLNPKILSIRKLKNLSINAKARSFTSSHQGSPLSPISSRGAKSIPAEHQKLFFSRKNWEKKCPPLLPPRSFCERRLGKF